MKSCHQGWLIEIQFTRPCSFESLSECAGLLALQPCKQMPVFPEQDYLNIGNWEDITAR
jgi:hypothetical protein